MTEQPGPERASGEVARQAVGVRRMPGSWPRASSARSAPTSGGGARTRSIPRLRSRRTSTSSATRCQSVVVDRRRPLAALACRRRAHDRVGPRERRRRVVGCGVQRDSSGEIGCGRRLAGLRRHRGRARPNLPLGSRCRVPLRSASPRGERRHRRLRGTTPSNLDLDPPSSRAGLTAPTTGRSSSSRTRVSVSRARGVSTCPPGIPNWTAAATWRLGIEWNSGDEYRGTRPRDDRH